MSNQLAFPMDESGALDTEINPREVASLNPYLAAAANIQDALNPVDAAKILATLSAGLAKCASLLGAASFNMNQAKTTRKQVEALAALEDFPSYLKTHPDVKSTDKTRDFYVDQHSHVLAAREKEAFFCALYEKLSINRNVLTMAISSARAIAYGHRDGSMMSSSATPADDR